MKKMIRNFVIALALTLTLTGTASAMSAVFVKNSTGYLFKEVKFVRVSGGKAQLIPPDLNNLVRKKFEINYDYGFVVKEQGPYVLYVSMIKNGQSVYAKTRVHTIKDGDVFMHKLENVFAASTNVGFVSAVEFENAGK